MFEEQTTIDTINTYAKDTIDPYFFRESQKHTVFKIIASDHVSSIPSFIWIPFNIQPTIVSNQPELFWLTDVTLDTCFHYCSIMMMLALSIETIVTNNLFVRYFIYWIILQLFVVTHVYCYVPYIYTSKSIMQHIIIIFLVIITWFLFLSWLYS